MKSSIRIISMLAGLIFFSQGIFAESEIATENSEPDEQAEPWEMPPQPILEEVAPGYYHPIYITPNGDIVTART